MEIRLDERNSNNFVLDLLGANLLRQIMKRGPFHHVYKEKVPFVVSFFRQLTKYYSFHRADIQIL